MRIFVDSADMQAIAASLAYGYVYGVTTNPTLLKRAGVRKAQVPTLAKQAIAQGAQEVHLQVYGTELDKMLHEADLLFGIDPQRIVIKIPATPVGYAAAAQLTSQGTRVTLTAVYTLRQALLAQSVGVHYIATYLGRMNDEGLDALAVVGQMQDMLKTQDAPVEILAASIRQPVEVEALAMLGVGTVTLPPLILSQLLESPATAKAATVFSEDAAALE